MNPQVSIILPTYNRAKILPRTIESILNQTFKNFELIIVDDGSTDDTEKIVKNFQRKDKRIVYIKNIQNRGVSFSRNKGIKIAKGEYIAFQDSDDEWLPKKLQKQVKIFEKLPNSFGVIYSDAIKIYEGKNKKYFSAPTLMKGIINNKTLDYQGLYILPPSTLIKRECFKKIGLFDEKLLVAEDLDFFTRASQYYRFFHIKEALILCYKTTRSISLNYNFYFKARKMLLQKYFYDIKNNKNFLAHQLRLIGSLALLAGKTKTGRNYLLKSIKKKPFNIKTLIIFLISFLGKDFLNFVKNIKDNFLEKVFKKSSNF